MSDCTSRMQHLQVGLVAALEPWAMHRRDFNMRFRIRILIIGRTHVVSKILAIHKNVHWTSLFRFRGFLICLGAHYFQKCTQNQGINDLGWQYSMDWSNHKNVPPGCGADIDARGFVVPENPDFDFAPRVPTEIVGVDEQIVGIEWNSGFHRNFGTIFSERWWFPADSKGLSIN